MSNPSWPLVATHGSVLFYVALHQDATIKEIAEALCVSARRVAQVVKDLNDTSMVSIERRGRRNRYSVDLEANLLQPSLSGVKVGDLVSTLR